MREGLTLCPHVAALAPGPAPFGVAPDEILDYSDGPVVAVTRCATCGACGWLELIDWEPSRTRTRVYALAAIRDADVTLYFRNRARGSCDAARSQAELVALAASAGPFERIVALEPSLEVVAVEAAGRGFAPPTGASSDRLGDLRSGDWLARLGLAKGALR
jgi:hypothetical protein